MLPIAATTFREVLRESAGTWIGLAFAIVVLAWIVNRVRAAFRSDADPAENANQMLSEIREMYEEGKLSEEEFRSIKGRLTKRKDSAPAASEE
ncbi:MAG: hypothetical protein U0992_15050 [Planctomycetaceae bacterium]